MMYLVLHNALKNEYIVAGATNIVGTGVVANAAAIVVVVIGTALLDIFDAAFVDTGVIAVVVFTVVNEIVVAAVVVVA